MNYTDSQIATWIKQLSESFRSSNFAGSCTYDMVVKKFLEQITNGVSVKIHRNCVLNPVECVIKSLQYKECSFFESPCDGTEMANKKRTKATARTKMNVRNSNKTNPNKPQPIPPDINNKTVLDNSKDNALNVLEACGSDEGLEITSGVSNLNNEVSIINYDDSVDDIVSSTPRTQCIDLPNGIAYDNELRPMPTSRNVRCAKNKTFIPDEVATKTNTRRCKNDNVTKTHNFQGFPQDDASFQAKEKNHFSLHDLLDLMSGKGDQREQFANKKEYIQKHITLEPTGANEGSEILFKLPNCLNTRAIIDLRDSKQMAEMMFLPVLADEDQRHKRQKPVVPASSVIDVTEYVTTTTTSTAPYQIHDGHGFPQLVGLPQSQQHALLQPNFAIYQPNLEPGKKNRERKINTSFTPLYLSQNQDSFYPYIRNTPYALPCVLLPSIGNTPQVTKRTPKIVNKNRSVKRNNTGKNLSPGSLNKTEVMPIKITSENGYKTTLFLNMPLNGHPDSSSLDVTQGSTPESSGYSTFELSNTIANFQNGNSPTPNCETFNVQPQKKRGRPKNQNKNPRKRGPPKTDNSVEKSKRGRKSKKNTKENIQIEMPCDESQEENFVTNNESFLACLDMPLINEEVPTEKSHELPSSAGQIQQHSSVFAMNSSMKLFEPISSTVKTYNQFNIQPSKASTSTLFPNQNFQPIYTNCTISENGDNLQNVTTYSATNNFSVPNGSTELLERFYIGEVGEVLENDTGSRVNEVQPMCNKSLESTIVCCGPTESLITTVKPNNDNLLFWNNEIPYNTNKSDDFITIITTENSNTKNVSSSEITNGMETKNFYPNIIPNPTGTNSFYEVYDLQQKSSSDQANKTILNNVVNIANSSETLMKKNDMSSHTKNAEIGITQTQHNDIFLNFAKNPNELETKLTNDLTTLNMTPHNNYMINKCLLMQSEYTQSSFTGFSEGIQTCQVSSENAFRSNRPEEFKDFPKAPALKNIKENKYLTNFAQNITSVSKNITEPCSVNLIQKFSKVEVKEPTMDKDTDVKTLSPLTGKSCLKNASLQESDLFLPPLELESKLNNDILDFDCESFNSSTDSLLGDDNKSVSDKSIGYLQNSIESNESPNVKQKNVFFRPLTDSSSESLKSWLGDKNDQVGLDQRANYENLPENNTNRSPKKILKTQEKLPGNKMILNKLISRRYSEVPFSSTKQKRRFSIDSIPSNLFSFKTSKESEMKNSMNLENPTNIHQNESDLSEVNILELLKQNLINKNLKSKTKSKEPLESIFIDMNTTKNITLHSPLKNAISQFPESLNFLSQQSVNVNLSSNNSQIDCKEIQIQSTYAERQNSDENPFTSFQKKNQINDSNQVSSKSLNEEKISPIHSVIEMAKFFNITCFPSLIENCPYGTLCPLSHNLRDVDWVRIELHRLSMEEVDLLYKFIYKHRILYTYYFNEFCYYYTENRKVISLCRMLVDFQRYQSFPANKLMIIYNCLMDCGLNKKNACENILRNLHRRSTEYLNAIMDIIAESDWTFFVNNVREIIADPSIVLNGNTLKKMAESFINNPDDKILGLFWQCIFKLDAAELQATQGHPAIKMIAAEIQRRKSGLF